MKEELPDGWAWARVSEITETVPNAKPEDYPSRTFGYVDISSIDNTAFAITELKQFKGQDAPSRARRPIQSNDVLFSNVRTYLRNVALVPDGLKADLCSTGFTVLRSGPAVMPRYLFRYVLSDDFIDRVTPQQTGTHYPATSDRVVMGERIPLPPLAEQRRIMAKLEPLLAKVDTCQQRLANIPVLIKRLRQSVLAAACSGRLTADWRGKHPDSKGVHAAIEKLLLRRQSQATTSAQKERIENIFSTEEENDSTELPDSWQYVALNKLCSSLDYGTSAKSRAAGKVPVLRMGNIQNGEIDWTNLVYTSDRDEIKSYSLQPNTVLFNRTNSPELVGKTAIYRGEQPAIFAGYLIRINPLPELDPEYLNYCLNTNYARGFCSHVKTDGVSQSNINAQRLGAFEVPFCSIAEQKEIVRRVKTLLAVVIAKLQVRLVRVQTQIDKLVPSILDRAFRGELVPTEAELARQERRDYEPASVLLERVQQQRVSDDEAETARPTRSKASTTGNVKRTTRPPRRHTRGTRASGD